MSYIYKQVSVYGIEKEFIKTFVQELTSADSRIVCKQTDEQIDAMFAEASNKPKIEFTIGNAQLALDRLYANVATQKSYRVSLRVGAETKQVYLHYCSSDQIYTATVTRIWNVWVVSNQDVIIVYFGNWDNASISACQFAVAGTKNNDISADIFKTVNESNIGDVLSKNWVGTDSDGKSVEVRMNANRLPYNRQSGEVEIIKNKAMLVGSDLKSVCEGLYDCTTVPAYTLLMIDGKKYYSVNDHTLMPCE